MRKNALRAVAVAAVLLLGAPGVGAATGGIADPSANVRTSPFARPALGVAATEPDFGTSIRRITNDVRRGSFGTQIYSQLQAFSADDQYVLLIEDNDYVVRKLSTLKKVAVDTSQWGNPRWYPAEPHSIVTFDPNDDTDVQVRISNLDTGQTTTVYTFPPQYRVVASNQSFDELSRNGRWMTGIVRRADGSAVIFALDLQTHTLGAMLPIPDLYSGPCSPDPTWGEVEPDWVGASPLGREVVVQWVRDGTTRCSGLETFDLATGAFLGRVSDNHDHGDLGVLPDGQTEMFMSWDYFGNATATAYRELPGTATVSPSHILQPMGWIGSHTSCQGPDGVCLVTASTDLSNGRRPFEGEVFLQYTDGGVLRLAHHRSSECGYWVQPRASLSASGRYAIFASDWKGPKGSSCGPGHSLGSGDAFVIDLGP